MKRLSMILISVAAAIAGPATSAEIKDYAYSEIPLLNQNGDRVRVVPIEDFGGSVDLVRTENSGRQVINFQGQTYWVAPGILDFGEDIAIGPLGCEAKIKSVSDMASKGKVRCP